MARASFVRRHRVGIASGAALVIAASAVAVYAVTASGYKKHEADLNDGGIWVVNGKKGFSGRLNKPINQLDGVVPSEDGKTRLDVVQDGASVVTLDLGSARGQAIETSRLELQNGGSAAVPAAAAVRMGGGSLASVDPETGEVWAVRYDSELGKPLVSSLDVQSDALAETGKDASLAVSLAGTLVVTSAADGTVTTIDPSGPEFGKPSTTDLPGDAGQVSDVTTVGERVVTLDSDSGVLRVLDGATASVPPGSLLQQSGPAYDAVLVGAADRLLSIDLDSGDVTTVTSTFSGSPVRPVRLGPCVFGAWSGGLGAVARQCGSLPVVESDLGGNASNLAFRVNRGEIVLNDASSGNVWDVEQDSPIQIDNWDAFTSKKQSEDDEKDNENPAQADRRPPTAKPDSYGVRPGRTTVLHPLDNDAAPEGRLLSIVDVGQPTGGARVEISPDGQTLVMQVPDKARPTTFDYAIDDGRSGLSARATVTVDIREGAENEPPELRNGYRKPVYRVPHGGALAVPVLADWRDDADGDTLLLDSAKAAGGDESGAMARITPDGRIRFSAPSTAAEGQQTVRVDFGVTDGRSPAVKKSLTFQVQAPQDQTSFPPSAEPDVVRGEVGKPIKIRPLLNDLPGSDPDTPNAELVLGAKVPQQPGSRVVSDLETGQLTFTSDRAGTYFLSYDAGYGNAELDEGTIRVDVKPQPKRAAEPIAMPDSLTIYGQAPGVIDVLANDLDPAGGLLTVQRAAGDRPGQLDVAIVDGRWLRISAVQPDLAPQTQTVSYSISNGTSSGVRGEVVVTQRAAPEDNTPVTAADRVIVRAGASVSVPVLDNDVSPAGDRLSLVNDVIDSPAPGELAVVAPIDVTGDTGRAFVSGRVVRYVAPDVVKERDTYEVTYVAQNLAGNKANGTLRVTVVPKDDPNDPPEPPLLESRVTSADAVKIRVPATGVDRNGDPVTVTGITSAPRLGRIVDYGGNFLQYEAYPRAVGTDEFTYAVVDSQGAFATGTVRVSVVAATQPQPPLAVDDRLKVAPGRTATFDPLANDFVAPGDSVEVTLLDAPDGAKLDPDTNLVTVPAPKTDGARPVVLVYSVTNGLDESRATMTLETAEGYNNPPIVYDAFGRVEDSGSVVIDVLDGAYDPDGPADEIQVVDVSGDESATVVDDVAVRANRGPAPKVLPFVIEDGEGATASASVYVPPTGSGLPYVVKDALITLDPGESTSGRIGDYVSAPGGAEVRLASGRRSWSASPDLLTVGPDGDRGFTLSAPDTFRGPGAVLVEVTTADDKTGNEDTTTTKDGATVLLSIPVLVGDDKPELQCPSSVVPISAGQRYQLDIASFCKVFTVDPRDEAGLDYSAEWSQSLDGVDVGSPDGSVVAVTAADTATQGGEAVLSVRAGESNTQEVRFRLAQAPPPTMNPVPVDAMEAGESRTIDVAPYLQAGVSDPEPTIVSVEGGGSDVRATTEGSRLTLTAAKDARGTKVEFRLVVSDVSSSNPPDGRVAQARIQFQVVGVPSPPGEPRPYQKSDEIDTVKMSWAPPDDDGGAPILYYEVKEQRKGSTQKCETNECVFRNLVKNSTGNYEFRVRAWNRVGPSDWSDLSKTARADTEPGRVQNIRMKSHGDGTITIAWDKPSVIGAARIDTYTISWIGGQAVVPGSQLSYPATGLNNNEKYVFTIKAQNSVGYSAPRLSAEFQPLGTPPAPAAPTVTDLESGPNQTSLRISWQAVLPEGQGPTVYTVSYTNGSSSGVVPGCQKLASLTCTHQGVPYDGKTYTYRVVAANQPGNRSPASEVTAIEAVGRPAQWAPFTAAATGTSQEVQLQYTVPDSRGTTSKVDILVGGAVNRSFNQQTGSITTRIQLPSNEQPYPVQLRVCNEKAPAGCTLSGQQSVQSYGRLDGMLNDLPNPSVSGKSVTWTATGTSNGDAAQLVYRIDGGADQVINLPGPGSFSQPITATTQEFAQDVKLQVWLRDNSPAGRGEDYAEDTAKSDVPQPGVTVTKGDACNDADPAAPNCGNGNDPDCNEATCARVVVTISYFYESATCSVNNSNFPNQFGSDIDFAATGSSSATKVSPWYYASGTVTVRCIGRGLFGKESIGSQTW